MNKSFDDKVITIFGFAIFMMFLSTTVKAETLTCVINNNTWTSTCNSTLIDNFFNQTNMTTNLTAQLNACQNQTTNLSTQVQILSQGCYGSINMTNDLIDCKQGQASCNTQLTLTLKDIDECKNNSASLQSQVAANDATYQAQITAKDTQCTTDKNALQATAVSNTNNMYIYIIVAFVLGGFILPRILKGVSHGSEVDKSTGDGINKNFQGV